MRENAIVSLTQALGDEAFNAAWEEGKALTLEQAAIYARKENAMTWEEALKSFDQKTKS
jgi:hypothetical protein